MKKIHLLMVLAVFCLFSCSKDDKSNKELLTQTQWKLVDAKFYMDGELETDYALEACDLDDVYQFNENNTYQHSVGTNLCDPDYDEDETGTWVLTNDETVLVLDGNPENGGTIETLNDSVLKVVGEFEETDGTEIIQVRTEITFNAI